MDGFCFNWQRHRKVLFLFFIVLFVFNSSIYVHQRFQWMGEGNANFEAKQYFTVGQTVFFHRKLASVFLGHPDRFNILVPLNLLQRFLYKVGVSKLPKEDGEKGVWADLWFVYIYSKNNELPFNIFGDRELGYDQFKGIDGEIVTDEDALHGKTPLLPKKNKYMDLVWFCLETMATKPFADRKMEEFHYLRNFAGEAQYYAYNAPGSYTKMYKNSGHFYAQMPELTARNEKLAVWLRELSGKWQRSEKVAAFIQKHPKIDAMRQMGLIMTLVDIFQARIWAHQFDCDDPYLGYLRDARKEFVDGRGNSPPSWEQMQNKKTAKMFYEIAINSVIARFTNFITEKECGESLPGEEDMREFQSRAISADDARKRQIRNLFPYELRLMGMTDVLEEKYWTKTVHGYEYQ